MRVLIAESNAALARIWSIALERLGAEVTVAESDAAALDLMGEVSPDVIVLDLALEGAVPVADVASYRCPDARVVFVTSSTFFSDGSIFNHFPNAGACVEAKTPAEDLAAIVEHFGRPGRPGPA